MDTDALLNAAAAYTQRIIDAVLPVAKKAYEIGLLTIRIDALSVIVPCVITLLIFGILLYKMFCWVRKVGDNCDEGHVMACLFLGVPSAVLAVYSLYTLLQIWLWVKLFAPDLWLAHEAILKVMSVAGK